MLRRYRSPISLVLTVVLAAPSGFAAPKAPKPKTVREELPDAARKDWDAARDLLDTSDFAGALVEYQRAYEQSKNPRVLYNVAICEKNLRHYARAEATFKQELTDGAGRISPQEEADVKAAILALEPFVSTLEVTANEPGATLLIDGEEMGKTPFDKPVPIDVGPHELRLHKDGFVDGVQQVTIAGGAPAKAAFSIEPAVKKATVSVAVTGAPGASVVIDGIDMGQAPFKGEVVAGRHTFEARAPGFVPARQTTDVVYKEPLNIALDLAVERHEGHLRIESTPAEATIEIDGRVVGSGTWEGPLAAGGHQLIVKRSGFQTYTSEISVSDDQSRDVSATLVKEKGSNWVAWTIGTVLVVAGGGVAGYFLFQPNNQSPVVGDLSPGTSPRRRAAAFTGDDGVAPRALDGGADLQRRFTGENGPMGLNRRLRMAGVAAALAVTAVSWAGCGGKAVTEYVAGFSTQVQVQRDLQSIIIRVDVNGRTPSRRTTPFTTGRSGSPGRWESWTTARWSASPFRLRCTDSRSRTATRTTAYSEATFRRPLSALRRRTAPRAASRAISPGAGSALETEARGSCVLPASSTRTGRSSTSRCRSITLATTSTAGRTAAGRRPSARPRPPTGALHVQSGPVRGHPTIRRFGDRLDDPCCRRIATHSSTGLPIRASVRSPTRARAARRNRAAWTWR